MLRFNVFMDKNGVMQEWEGYRHDLLGELHASLPLD